MVEVGKRRLYTRYTFEAMPDEQVVLYAKRGSQPATQHLLSKYRGLVEGKAKAFFLIGADHEDVVQEGMIGLFKAIRDFSTDNLSAFKSFAELCITRQIITAIKTATRQKHRPLNYSVSIDLSAEEIDCNISASASVTASATDDPHRVAGGRQLCRMVRDYMESDLSKLEADTLLLYMRGKTYRQIARILGCDAKQVDNALQRAKKKLGRNLKCDSSNS